jgi:hypothetical protein
MLSYICCTSTSSYAPPNASLLLTLNTCTHVARVLCQTLRTQFPTPADARAALAQFSTGLPAPEELAVTAAETVKTETPETETPATETETAEEEKVVDLGALGWRYVQCDNVFFRVHMQLYGVHKCA